MSLGQVDYVLLSRVPRSPQQGNVRLAWLNLNPIAVGSGRINRSRLSGVWFALLRSELSNKAHVRSNYSLELHFLYAHLEAVHITDRALPKTQRRRRQAMRKFYRGSRSGYKPYRKERPIRPFSAMKTVLFQVYLGEVFLLCSHTPAAATPRPTTSVATPRG
jgi:hypothetical protein